MLTICRLVLRDSRTHICAGSMSADTALRRTCVSWSSALAVNCVCSDCRGLELEVRHVLVVMQRASGDLLVHVVCRLRVSSVARCSLHDLLPLRHSSESEVVLLNATSTSHVLWRSNLIIVRQIVRVV